MDPKQIGYAFTSPEKTQNPRMRQKQVCLAASLGLARERVAQTARLPKANLATANVLHVIGLSKSPQSAMQERVHVL